MEINSKAKIAQRSLGVFLLLLSLGFIGLGVIIAFSKGISGMSIVTGFMFLWMGIGFLLMTLNNMKTVKIKGESAVIGTWFGLLKKYYKMGDIESTNPKSFRNKWRSYPGLLILFRDGRQVHLHEMEFENFRELKKTITYSVNKHGDLELEIWTPLAIGFVSFGALLIFGLIVIKAMAL